MAHPFAIITGASTGIGFELATLAAKDGYDILVVADEPLINDAARERKLQVMLVGSAGNAGLSREGRDLLPQLVRNGRWLKLWREGRALTRQGVGYRTVLANSFGP